MPLEWCDRPISVAGMRPAGAIADSIAASIGLGGSAPGARRRWDVDLELAHEPQEIGPLEPQRPGRAGAIAA
jgi:hypothetical protein